MADRSEHPVVGLHHVQLAAGVEVVEDVELAGHERCYVFDPFGSRVELIERA